MPDLLTFGECMVEFFADEPLTWARTFTKTFGGDSCNAAVAAARLGTSVGYLTRVGDDPFAPFLLDAWQRHGLDTSRCRLVPGFNGLYLISVQADGERQFTYYRDGSAASTSSPEDLDEPYVAQARWLHVTGVSQAISPSCRATVRAALLMAKEHGLSTSFDPNLRLSLWSLQEARAAMLEILPLVDVVFPSLPEEATALTGANHPEAVARFFLDHGVQLVVGKLGADGCFTATERAYAHIGAFLPDRVVDTSGAGDAFAGAFLHGMLSTGRPDLAARIAVVTAGLKLRARGALESQPNRDEVYETVERTYGAWRHG